MSIRSSNSWPQGKISRAPVQRRQKSPPPWQGLIKIVDGVEIDLRTNKPVVRWDAGWKKSSSK